MEENVIWNNNFMKQYNPERQPASEKNDKEMKNIG